MLILQCITQVNPCVFSDIKELVELGATVIGGICALKGINYIDSLRKRKVISTFSFESQLYARIYELSKLISGNETLFTNLFSEDAIKEWGEKNSAPKEEIDLLYDNAKETLDFIKNVPDQMPVYATWSKDYRDLIKRLVDIVHYDIRSSKKGFKFTDRCPVEDRKRYCDSFYELLNTMLMGIESDQDEMIDGLF